MKHASTCSLLVLALAATACGAPPLGDPYWQHAELCTTDELFPVVQDAANRWNSSRITALTVRVAPRGSCDADVREVESIAAGADHAGLTSPGDVQLKAGTATDVDGSDRVAHELGHLLEGGNEVHNPDPESVMFWLEQNGEQDILPSDTDRVGVK